METKKLFNQMACCLAIIFLSCFYGQAGALNSQQEQYIPVDNKLIPEILTMISEHIRENYDKIRTWQGKIEIVADDFYKDEEAERIFKENVKSEGNEPVPKMINEHTEGYKEFALDVAKNLRYESYASYSPIKYTDIETGRQLQPKGRISIGKAILTADHHLDCVAIRNRNDVIVSREVVKQKRPEESILRSCGSKLYPVYDPRESFSVFGNPLWEVFPGIAATVNEEGSFEVDGYSLKVEKYKSADVTKYRIVQPGKINNDYAFSTLVFSSEAGFNAVSFTFGDVNNRIVASKTWDYQLVNGVYIPLQKIEQEFDYLTGDLKKISTVSFVDQQVNVSLNDEIFTTKNLGLQDGDKFIDKIADKEFEYQAGELIEISEKSLKNSGENISKWGHSQNQTSISESKKNVQISQNSNDVLEVVTTEPNSPAVLKVGEKMNVTIFYELKSLEKAAIWSRPYFNGNLARNYSAHHLTFVSNEPNDTGFVAGWFYFDKPAQIDEVRVFMRDLATNNTVKTISHKVSAQWIESKGQ